jgi:hypothetical protein
MAYQRYVKADDGAAATAGLDTFINTSAQVKPLIRPGFALQ